MSKKDPIMERMKSNYEMRSRTSLVRRMPVIIRLDGKAFHTYTKGLDRPFDEGLISDMSNTAKFLCEQIQGAKIAYTQSDEISILLTDYDNLSTDAWFDNQVQKMVSVSASMATAKFNQLRILNNDTFQIEAQDGGYHAHTFVENLNLALFDARVFNIPKEEVANYFYARQRDAVKNSISMLAQSLYSHKELHEKNSGDMQEMCFQKGHNWNNLHYTKKRGNTIVKNTYINDEGPVKVWPEIEADIAGKLEFYPKNCRKDIINNVCRRFTPSTVFPEKWEIVDIKKIRTKWEQTETPITFNHDYFKKYL